MYISHIALDDFRSYHHQVIECDPGVNVFIGANGQGKTNIVEALVYISTLSSHRFSKGSALIRQGGNAGVIRVRCVDKERTFTLDLEIFSGQANRARHNSTVLSPMNIIGEVPTVIFSPEDIDLIRGERKKRRKFLDTLLIQLRPSMARVFQEYNKILHQRAAALKNASTVQYAGVPYDENSLNIWDAQLAQQAAKIISERSKLIHKMRPWLEHYYMILAGEDKKARIDYSVSTDTGAFKLPSIEKIEASDELRAAIDEHENELFDVAVLETNIRQMLKEIRPKEVERGVNLRGPHRDDLVFSLGTMPVYGYASHGESWSFALALRLASLEILREENGSDPILILDDVFAELDAYRRACLTDIIARNEQVFITAAVGDDLPDSLDGKKFSVTLGNVSLISPDDK
ncbi:MAG: DNA replication/repair protein RecF [Actinomycetaceae bacterium]|nr:DNA replication/repair protein RecF [Actinomycetaceae bacterium]